MCILRGFQRKGVCLSYYQHFFSQVFIQQIISQLSSGAKSDPRKYLKLSRENLEGCVFYIFILSRYVTNAIIYSQRVRVNDKDGNVMLIVIPDMPDHIRNPLLNDLELAHPCTLEVVDSGIGGEKAKFQHIHYQYWNRYHINVILFYFFTNTFKY